MTMVCDDTELMIESDDYILPSSYRNAALALDADAKAKRDELFSLFDISDGKDGASPMIDNDMNANIKHISEMSAALRDYFEDFDIEFADNITNVAAKIGSLGGLVDDITPTHFVPSDYGADYSVGYGSS